MSYTKNDILSVNYTLFPPGPNDVICCLLFSRVVNESDFNSILGTEIKSYGGAYPIPLRTIYVQRTIDLNSDVLHNFVLFVQF